MLRAACLRCHIHAFRSTKPACWSRASLSTPMLPPRIATPTSSLPWHVQYAAAEAKEAFWSLSLRQLSLTEAGNCAEGNSRLSRTSAPDCGYTRHSNVHGHFLGRYRVAIPHRTSACDRSSSIAAGNNGGHEAGSGQRNARRPAPAAVHLRVLLVRSRRF